jgi:hypothetical protein
MLGGSAEVGDKRPNTDSAGSFMSRRKINTCVTSHGSRNVSHVNRSKFNRSPEITHGTCELDSHANTSIADQK